MLDSMSLNKVIMKWLINYHFVAIVVSASQGGKGILIQNLVLKVYRNCFERIYIVSPTAHIDEAYREVIKYIEKDLKVDNKKRTVSV